MAVADTAILANGEELRIVMFNGTVHKAMIKDTQLNKVKSYFWEVHTVVHGRTIKLMYDFSEEKKKELIDPKLLLAIVNDDVHKIEFTQ